MTNIDIDLKQNELLKGLQEIYSTGIKYFLADYWWVLLIDLVILFLPVVKRRRRR